MGIAGREVGNTFFSQLCNIFFLNESEEVLNLH